MSHARLYRAGTVDEIFSDAESLTKIGLNVPEVARVADRLIAAGIPLEGKLYTVEGVRDALLRYRKEGRR